MDETRKRYEEIESEIADTPEPGEPEPAQARTIGQVLVTIDNEGDVAVEAIDGYISAAALWAMGRLLDTMASRRWNQMRDQAENVVSAARKLHLPGGGIS